MKSRLIVVAVCLLVVMSHVAVAQTPRVNHEVQGRSRPSCHHRRHREPFRRGHRTAVRIPASPPAGPSRRAQGIRRRNDLIAQRLSAELSSISQANRANQITRDEAEYLIQDRYQVAMMQREVLSALHDSLQHDLAQAEKQPDRDSPSDTAVVVVKLPLAEKGRPQ